MELVTVDKTRVVLDNYEESFNDGKWHSIILVLKNDFLELNVDNRPMQTIRKLDFMTGPKYSIAGLILFIFKYNYYKMYLCIFMCKTTNIYIYYFRRYLWFTWICWMYALDYS